MIRKPIALLILVTMALAAVGCGVYSASPGRVDEGIKNVAVQYLENMTSEPNIEVALSDAIIYAIRVDNRLKVVDEGDADTIISGKVVLYKLQEVMARGENLTVDEYQVQISVMLDMAFRATGEKIFEKKRFNGTGNYNLEEDSGTSEETARNEAAAEIVRDILAMVVDDW